MAPEVLNALPYGKAADIYSFTLVIWHLLSLETPFLGVDGKKEICDAFKKIHKKGRRPKLKRGGHVNSSLSLPAAGIGIH